MRMKQIIAGTAVLLTLLITVDVANAFVVKFNGTQDQVRAACTGPDRVLIDSPGDTTCIDKSKGTGVSCGPAGDCHGSGPRRASGSFDVVAPFGMGPAAPAGNLSNGAIPPIGTLGFPKSLSEPATGSISAPAAPAPTPPPTGDDAGDAPGSIL
jgi:hypothetical protein